MADDSPSIRLVRSYIEAVQRASLREIDQTVQVAVTLSQRCAQRAAPGLMPTRRRKCLAKWL